MSVLNNNTTDNQFELLHTTGASGDWTAILATENKFVDKNIAVRISTPAAGALTFVASDNTDTTVTVGSVSGNVYPITASISGTLTAATAGWVTTSGYSISDNSVVVGTIAKANPVTSYSDTGMSTYFDEVTNPSSASDYNVSITPKYTNNAGYLAAHSTATNAGGERYWSIKTVTPTFKAEPTGSSDATFSNITYSTTNNGIKVQTRYKINAVDIKYNAAATGWISKAASADTGSDTTAKALTNSGVYYITGITVPTATNFTLTTTTNSSTDTSKVTITNNNNRNIEITNAGTVYARQTTSGKGNVYVQPYGGSDIQIVSNGTMLTSTVTIPTWSKNSSKVATMNNFTYTDGYITGSNLPAATFAAAATSGVTYLDLDDALVSANGDNVVPELAANGRLYISRGYIDNVSISLGHLLADAAQASGLAANHIRVNHSAYDSAGNLIVGTIPDLNATTYYPKASDQTIAAGKYINGTQTIKAVTTNATAAMIAYGTTLKIGDSADDDRVKSVTGTFTQTGTQTSGQTVAAAAQILPGYSAWVNGAEVLGAMPTATITADFNFPGSNDTDLDNYLTGRNTTSGDVSIRATYTNTEGHMDAHSTAVNSSLIYYNLKAPTFADAGGLIKLVATTDSATDTKRSIYTSSSISYITISDTAPALADGKVYIKVTSEGQVKTTSTGRGAIKSNVTVSTKGTHTSYIGLTLYDGTYTA